jgi:hypothetical protein
MLWLRPVSLQLVINTVDSSLFFLYIHLPVFFLLFVVNMDDCWQKSRDAQGTIQPDPGAFPSGIPALVDYVHSKKLKFGLYSGMLIGCYSSIHHVPIVVSRYIR